MTLDEGQVAELFANYEVIRFEIDGPVFIWRLRAPLAVSYDHVEREWRLYVR